MHLTTNASTILKLCICQIFAHVPVLWQKQKPSEEAKSVVQRRVAGVIPVIFATSGVVPFFARFRREICAHPVCTALHSWESPVPSACSSVQADM